MDNDQIEVMREKVALMMAKKVIHDAENCSSLEEEIVSVLLRWVPLRAWNEDMIRDYLESRDKEGELLETGDCD